ncbi:hypothetical protein HF086_006015 [Spodoptera exigua]|uniref:Peptidase aspartic putative domain-containing protein n=1 Tax=Spodoptera exigua TaxID=7107 RepID=A0A922MY16_SPOEX|nr:hypothetical protein HF086_006015 [Spodoptera exigua]
MNKLALQSACFENIKTLCNNYNKDSKTRKTKEYLNKRLTSLEAQWVDFNTRHTLLSQEIEDKNINYFMDDIYANSTSTENQRSGQRPSKETGTASSNHLSANNMEVLLTTVQVKVMTVDGTYINLRALVDQGSQVNLITENAAQLLRLPRNKLTAKISGVGSVSGDCKGQLSITCKSIHSEYTFNTEALIMKKLINKLPNNTFERPEWSYLKDIKLADPEFNISRSVDILFGADVYAEIIQDGVLKGTPRSPVAQQTQLGWILCGKLETFKCNVTLLDLSEIAKFWESEEVTIKTLIKNQRISAKLTTRKRLAVIQMEADIEKMYRCIWLSEEQQHLQKIIWRPNSSDKLQEYQLCTVTYGTKSAPWLAMRTIKQLAFDDGYKYPTAAKVLLNEAYVDDVISGHNSLNAALELQTSLIEMLKGAGMNLRKWSSNEPTLLKNLKGDQISSRITFDFKQDETMKTLGLGWNPRADTFVFNWKFQEKCLPKITKRQLLSEISQLYDPLGWLSPITIAAKIIFQEVWVNKLDWDDQLPLHIADKWLKLRADITNVKYINVKRWLGSMEQKIELFGFCDASEKAYSCVVYSCVRDEQNKATITLLAAKTRVAPLSSITLPKLELCGALLLSQLIKKIKEALNEFEITTTVWCDSQVVLAWIQGDTSKREKYVANRVAKIRRCIPAEQWNYVKSQDNPADCASRGLTLSKLTTFSLWWQGPTFLTTLQKQSREENITCTFTTNLGKESQAKMNAKKKNSSHNNCIHNLLNNCSSLTKTIRIVAWIRRFLGNARNSTKRDTVCLSFCELSNAEELIIKYVQRTELAQEYKQLMKKENISSNCNIYKLKPYLDDKGIIRVGGRLNYSSLSFEMKNPVILPKGGRFTELLIQKAHLTTLHGGARLTLAYIRQRYWIIGGNRAVKLDFGAVCAVTATGLRNLTN